MAPNYDYLLFVGPGRSGTTHIYRALKVAYPVVFPEIKEGYYYRDPKRYRSALGHVSPATHILGDVVNLAYIDPSLPTDIAHLTQAGQRVLVVVTVRNHAARAASQMRFDASRGRWDLERRALGVALTPLLFRRLLDLPTDVVVVDFHEFTVDPLATLNALARMCGIPEADVLPDVDRNESESARLGPLSALAPMAAGILRQLGLRRLLQALKDNPLVWGFFFKPSSGAVYELSEEITEELEQMHVECWRIINTHLKQAGCGVYTRGAVVNSPRNGS